MERFQKATDVRQVRMIMMGEGLDGTGKTHFGLTAPGDIAFINTDVGLEGVVERFAKDKNIFVSNYLETYKQIKSLPETDARDVMEMYTPLWESIKSDFMEAAETKAVKSVVVDSFTTAWEIARFARLGRIALPPEASYKYGPVNDEFVKFVHEGYSVFGKNVILLHRLKPEYINDSFTGEYILDGCRKIPFEVQVKVRLKWDKEKGFGLTILKCRQNGALTGLELWGDDCSFNTLMSYVFEQEIQ